MIRRIFKGTKKNNSTILIFTFIVIFMIYRKYKDTVCMEAVNEKELSIIQESLKNFPGKDSEDNKKYEDSMYNSRKRKLNLDDIVFTVKTTKKNLKKRLRILLDTWIPKAKSQTYIITDELDEDTRKRKSFNFVTTSCGTDHKWEDLSCKTVAEYKAFKKNAKKWWCHLDDDIYLNPTRMVALLNQYEWRDWYYIGRISRPGGFKATYKGKNYSYLFVHGGVYCISRSLADQMTPWMTEKVFVPMSVGIKRADDVTIGLIVNGMLNVSITEPVAIHTHSENQTFVDPNRFKFDATFNYAGNENTVSFGNTKPLFSTKQDPTRFYSLHCMIYPHEKLCKTKKRNK